MNRRMFFASAAAALNRTGPRTPIPRPRSSPRIRPPEFPDRDFDVTKFGARGDGSMNCDELDPQSDRGLFGSRRRTRDRPARRCFSPARFTSNPASTCIVSEGATLRFSRDPKDYLPVVFSRWEGTECMNYSPFVYAFEQTNIAITGARHARRPGGLRALVGLEGQSRLRLGKGQPNQAKDRAALQAMGESTDAR